MLRSVKIAVTLPDDEISDVMYQIRDTVSYHICKHRKESQRYFARWRIVDKLLFKFLLIQKEDVMSSFVLFVYVTSALLS